MPLTKHSPPAESTQGLASGNKSPKHSILQLNDDCLLEVFSHLSLKDLCAVKNCSWRFSNLADSVVRTRWRNKEYVCDLADFSNDESEAVLALAKFGHFISKLGVRGIHCTKIAVKNFGANLDNCTSLEKLHLKFVDLSLLLTGQCQVLQHIKVLNLDNCLGNNWQHAKLVKICTKLIFLKILKFGHGGITKALAAINDHASIKEISIGALFSSLNQLKNVQQLGKLNDLFVFLKTTPIADDNFFKGFNDLKKLGRLRIYAPIEISNARLKLATNFEFECESKPLRRHKYKYILNRKKQELDFDSNLIGIY